MYTNTIPHGCTLQEYRKKYANEKHYSSLRTCAIVGYVLVGINVLLALLGNFFALFDVAVYLGLVLGMHLGRSKGCVIGILCYSIFGVVLGLILNGALTGWLWPILAISALKTFKKIDEDYEQIRKNPYGGYYQY